ncbi:MULTISPECIES: hypothetical protein [unclassified Neisseria]|uniref:hypothetical protein n=1 Tax=unclassified Neisseria TaxID=2623750 RepID=UPI001072A957|nr:MULTISPECIES: hypothetical protein [unclassified Neisseria]MBF0804845.1 hypothetical protein [Neisseria sp. 19428wB4_WF04]TFU39438.1 hypothetical protein E4T99_11055 [Neisseria sp. WF04]
MAKSIISISDIEGEPGQVEVSFDIGESEEDGLTAAQNFSMIINHLIKCINTEEFLKLALAVVKENQDELDHPELLEILEALETLEISEAEKILSIAPASKLIH